MTFPPLFVLIYDHGPETEEHYYAAKMKIIILIEVNL